MQWIHWYYRMMKLGLISQAASLSAKISQVTEPFFSGNSLMIEYHGTNQFVLFRLGAAWEFTIPLASCWKGPLAVELEQWNKCCGTVELTTFTMDYDAAHQRQISTGTHHGPTMDPLWTATDHCKSTAWKLFRHDIRPVASLHYSDPSDVKIKSRPDMRPDLQYDQPIFQWFFPVLFFSWMTMCVWHSNCFPGSITYTTL